MTATLKRGDPVNCPHCGELQDDRVEDFVIPGLIGVASEAEEECVECYAPFTVRCVAADLFEVRAKD